jgi:hypothetical protein
MLLTYFKRRNGQWFFTVKCFEIKYILGLKNYKLHCIPYDNICVKKMTNVDINKVYKVDQDTYVYNNDFFNELLNDNSHVEQLD